MIFPRIKICCIKNENEARSAVNHGASAIGLVGSMPSGPGIITDDEIRKIAASVPPPVATFLLTSETIPEKIIAHYKRAYTSVIQIVDAVDTNCYKQIRKELPHVKIVQVIHVIDQSSIAEAVKISEHIDTILLDSGNPNAKIKTLGGTGQTHNWHLSREIVKSVKTPVFLAGGINSANVAQAIEIVQPFGIDLCSSVRTDDVLDKQKLKQFFHSLETYKRMKNAINRNEN